MIGAKVRTDINQHESYVYGPLAWHGLSLMALPCLIMRTTLQESTLERGLHCLGCAKATCRQAKWHNTECRGCQFSGPGGVDVPLSTDPSSRSNDSRQSCRVVNDRDKLYTKEKILPHILGCGNAQAYLADLDLERERFARV